jgi:hypothetical protein
MMNKDDLDRHITGNYGEDSVVDDEEICIVCGQEEAGCTCDKYLGSDQELTCEDCEDGQCVAGAGGGNKPQHCPEMHGVVVAVPRLPTK